MIDAEGQPFYGPAEDAALFETLKKGITNPDVEIVDMDCHINDAEFEKFAEERRKARGASPLKGGETKCT